MKSIDGLTVKDGIPSPLAIAEWIEIPSPVFCKTRILSPLAIAEWIEIMGIFCFITVIMSPLAIAEWIEIPLIDLIKSIRAVSASDSGVD